MCAVMGIRLLVFLSLQAGLCTDMAQNGCIFLCSLPSIMVYRWGTAPTHQQLDNNDLVLYSTYRDPYYRLLMGGGQDPMYRLAMGTLDLRGVGLGY